MDRILILMDAHEYADAHNAILSARQNAAHPEALSYGFTLQEYPEDESFSALEALGALFIPMAEQSIWAEMERLWAGEEYVLMAHPAMRFTPGWDRGLLKALHLCRPGQVMTCALTGCLPVASDRLGEVCTVAADEFLPDGSLSLQRGMPMRHMKRPVAGPFLHPDFCFAPSGFFRAVASAGDMQYLEAHRSGWQLYTLHTPLIHLQYDMPLPPVTAADDQALLDSFAHRFGVDFTIRTVADHARRGMQEKDFSLPEEFPRKLRMAERWRRFRYRMTHLLKWYKEKITPHAVTLVTPDMPEETEIWLRQLARLENLSLTAYAPSALKRQVVEYLPNVYDLQPQHTMEIAGVPQEALLPLSKAAALSATRDRTLKNSHYVWMDPDCVRHPVFPGAFFDWESICTDQIFIAMVDGHPDTSIFVVPDRMILDLANDLQARAIAILNQRGALPSETELWEMVIRENPGWFQHIVCPRRGQLFLEVCRA
ncbi:MAG: hypothetical protein IKK57_13230 [Clostridia bacterium]|nr:hypothetical protein [Clostridia bacterium]